MPGYSFYPFINVGLSVIVSNNNGYVYIFFKGVIWAFILAEYSLGKKHRFKKIKKDNIVHLLTN